MATHEENQAGFPMPPTTVPQALQAAAQRQQQGQLFEAEAIYRQILAGEPAQPQALHGLGVVLFGLGQKDAALRLIDQAIGLKADEASYHYNRGMVLANLARAEEAIAALRRALALQPDFSPAAYNLGQMLRGCGRFGEAIDAFRLAVRLQPDRAETWLSLGIACGMNGDAAQAIAAYRRALALQPDNVQALYNLGNALYLQNDLDESIACFRRALAVRPDCIEAINNLGVALKARQDVDGSIDCYRRALAHRGDDPEALNNLGVTLFNLGQIDEALAQFDRAILHHPENKTAHSNRLYTLHFHPDWDGLALRREHEQWYDRHARDLAREIPQHGNDPDPDRPLRIGYVSGDFRSHPVGLAILPLLEHHDHRQFQIVCFSNNPSDDEVTRSIAACADQWHRIAGWSDSQVARQVAQCQIDILVDLSLHMAHNRLLVFARRPAPVQLTYLGYPGTTGLAAIDYRLSDPYLDPPGTDDCYTETTIRLPRTYICWKDKCGDRPIGPPPALARGHVTFGSLNSFCKVTPAVLATWAKLLCQVKDSRLVLRGPAGRTAQAVLETLGRLGVAPERVELVERLPWEQYLDLLGRLDIALDPFPYPGHTTSLDALWMGVALVTLRGRTAVGRGGVSILSNLGLAHCIARDPDEYLDIAKDLSRDLPRLVEMRAGLRERMRNSPLTDAAGLARDVEAAYRDVWKRWCHKHDPARSVDPPVPRRQAPDA
ncbi:MAG: tetratricopeptide repeat protein [Tepidisphaeraceae bacterium]